MLAEVEEGVSRTCHCCLPPLRTLQQLTSGVAQGISCQGVKIVIVVLVDNLISLHGLQKPPRLGGLWKCGGGGCGGIRGSGQSAGQVVYVALVERRDLLKMHGLKVCAAGRVLMIAPVGPRQVRHAVEQPGSCNVEGAMLGSQAALTQFPTRQETQPGGHIPAWAPADVFLGCFAEHMSTCKHVWHLLLIPAAWMQLGAGSRLVAVSVHGQ